MKRCPACGETKALDEFPNNRASKDGKATYCKPCHNRIMQQNRIKHHGSTRSFHLKRRYGVSAVDVEWKLLQQNFVCALCGADKAEHVDHDHVGGELRGILCFNCNRALGYFDDDWETLCRAGDYLELHGV